MAALPLTISLIVFTGRPMRRASSDCDIPRSWSASRSTSPGVTAQSRSQMFESAAMVIDDLRDQDLGHGAGVHAALRQLRQWVVIRHEDKPGGAAEVDSELTRAVTLKLMRASRDASHVSECRRRFERSQ